jgi:hypothetical protein
MTSVSPATYSFHQFLHSHHHLSSRTCTIGHLMSAVIVDLVHSNTTDKRMGPKVHWNPGVVLCAPLRTASVGVPSSLYRLYTVTTCTVRECKKLAGEQALGKGTGVETCFTGPRNRPVVHASLSSKVRVASMLASCSRDPGSDPGPCFLCPSNGSPGDGE